MTGLEVVVPVEVPRSIVVTANDREHWRAAAVKTADLRTLAAYAKLRHARELQLMAADCVCLVEFGRAARRDVHNWMPSAKALVDGMVSGPGGHPSGAVWLHRILADDSGRYLTGPDLREGVDPSLDPDFVRFTFTFTERDPG